MLILEMVLLGATAFVMLMCFIEGIVERETKPYTMIFFIVGIITNIVAIKLISRF